MINEVNKIRSLTSYFSNSSYAKTKKQIGNVEI
jgi:hypothetical protein